MITIFTDGSCDRNHIQINKGGWGFVIINDSGIKVFEKSGSEKNTTNNRMEIIAVLEAIKKVNLSFKNEEVLIYSDSEYVINTITKNWKRNKNNDLWDQLFPLITKNISFKLVKGHNSNVWNEYVYKLAFTETKKEKKFTIVN